MNLFVDSLANYLADQSRQVLEANSDSSNKITLVVQSFPLKETAAVINKLDDYLTAHFPGKKRVIKIALGLWNCWSAKEKDEYGGSDELANRWVDTKDQLVVFRNEGHCIFFGFDHSSDKGSLRDFHLVNEQLIWERVLEGGFDKWADRIADVLGDVDSTAKRSLLEFLSAVHRFNVRNLVHVSRFLCEILASKPESLREFVSECYVRLPEWSGLPLVDVNIGRNPARLNKLVDLAHRFSTHALFTTRAERDKAIAKIQKARQGEHPFQKFELPQPVLQVNNIYVNAEQYLDDVQLYIREASPSALERLKGWDAVPILSVLEKRATKGKSTQPKAVTLKGYSDTVFLQAIQQTLEDLIDELGPQGAADTAEEIIITLTSFETDGAEPEVEIRRLLGGIVGQAIPETLTISEEGQSIPVSMALESLVTKTAKGIAKVTFSVAISPVESAEHEPKVFVWPLPANHPERLRLVLADKARGDLTKLSSPRLPVFEIGGFDELFYAIDEDDAHRLLLLGINDFSVKNAFEGLPLKNIEKGITEKCTALTSRFCDQLNQILDKGFYVANASIHLVVEAYNELVLLIIDPNIQGADYVWGRFYRAFLAVRENDVSTDSFLDAAVALPISPFVMELSAARSVFLRDGFGEVILELFSAGPQAAQQRWQRLVGLAELRRPIVALVTDVNKVITTRSRSFGLTHVVGSANDQFLSVASQSLMRNEVFDEDDLSQKLKPNANSRIYERLIRDYQKLHPHAHDQMSILFTNVLEIDVMLSGVDRWLKDYLVDSKEHDSPFVLNVKAITAGVAATASLNVLIAWKNAWAEAEFNEQRRCVIQIGHRHANSILELEGILSIEPDLGFDLAFISHFLEGQHNGDQLESVPSFDVVEGMTLRQFPIAEYPRPATAITRNTGRKTLISNRRILMASKHTEVSARLKNPDTPVDKEHVVMTQIDFTEWKSTVGLLHKKALWVSCIDRYVDSNLLTGDDHGRTDRRIVGFSCGLGAYGELNQTVSTELNDLAQLTKAIAKRLRENVDALSTEQAELAASRVVTSACEIPGLSLVRAAGHDEYIRDVVGYSLVNRLFGQTPDSVLRVLIPLDSFRHWFLDRDDPNIPDLLLLSACVKDGLINIDASIIESKFGHENTAHSEKAFAQARAGLRQLTRIFAPQGAPIAATVFERKYWWAQLHRALSSRAVVDLPVSQYKELCVALEKLGEGIYKISWRAVAVTFWTDKKNVDTSPTMMGPADIAYELPLPQDFGIYQMQFGADAIIKNLISDPYPISPVPGPAFKLTFASIGEGQQMVSANGATGQNADAGPEIKFPSSAAVTPTSAISEVAEPSKVGHDNLLSAVAPVDVSVPTTTLAANSKPQVLPAPPAVPAFDAAATSFSPQAVSTALPIRRLLLGKTAQNADVHWEYGDPDLENRHMLIFGGSGSGKTYAIQCLLLEMAKQGQHAAIIDYTDGFLPSHLEEHLVQQVAPATHVLVQQPFPINPFQRLSREEPGIGILHDQPHNVASRVSDVFCSVYDVGDVQRAALAKHIEAGLSDGGHFGLEELHGALAADPDTPPTLTLKIAELVKQKPFANTSDSGWEQIYRHLPLVHILQLTNLSKDIQRLIAEFALWDFFAYATRNGSKNTPLPIVLDEVQNLDHRTDRALDKLLREGRKFGVSMILATQTISNFNKEQRSRLFQAGHKLFFKPAETERREFAQILAESAPVRTRDEWVTELSKLGKGECWSIGPRRISENGPVRRDPIKLRITAMSER